MGFREGAYATVWEISKQEETYSRIRLSTSRKDKRTDEFVTDFNGYVTLLGDAHKKIDRIAAALEDNERCRIRLGAGDVSNRYDKDQEKQWYNIALFDFELVSSSSDTTEKKPKTSKKSSKKAPTKAKKKEVEPPLLDEDEYEDDDSLPF